MPTVTRYLSPAGTPAPTPFCKVPVANVTVLTGIRGVAPQVDVSRWGNTGMYTSGSCAYGFSTLFSGPRAVYQLNLGAGVPVGGILTVTTCGHSSTRTPNTVLYVGVGCPTWGASFGCIKGNDDAADGGVGLSCAGNPLASTVRLGPVGSRVFFVQMGGYLGAPVVSGLAWTYTLLPAASTSRSATRTRTRSRVPASRSATPSRTRKPK
jgi:hypothetical protein